MGERRRRRRKRLGRGWRRGGAYFVYRKQTQHTQKWGREDSGFRCLEGSSFLDFPSLLDSLVVCMCCCNPSPFPPCFFDVYKPRQQGAVCAGGGQTPLLPFDNVQSSFLSLGPRSGSETCLAFPKTGRLFGVNQRDTDGPERP